MSITINPWSKSQWVLAASVFNIRKCVCVGYWTSYWPPSSPRDSLAAPLLAGGNSAEPREFKTVQVTAGGPMVGRLTGISLPARAGTTSTLLWSAATITKHRAGQQSEIHCLQSYLSLFRTERMLCTCRALLKGHLRIFPQLSFDRKAVSLRWCHCVKYDRCKGKIYWRSLEK